MKQTAVEWLVEQLQQNKFITKSQIHFAKQMEKEQIVEAWNKNPQGFNNNGEKYYNETYKK